MVVLCNALWNVLDWMMLRWLSIVLSKFYLVYNLCYGNIPLENSVWHWDGSWQLNWLQRPYTPWLNLSESSRIKMSPIFIKQKILKSSQLQTQSCVIEPKITVLLIRPCRIAIVEQTLRDISLNIFVSVKILWSSDIFIWFFEIYSAVWKYLNYNYSFYFFWEWKIKL